MTALVVIDCKTGRVARFLDRAETHAVKFSDGNTLVAVNGSDDHRKVIEEIRARPEKVFAA